MKGFISYCHEDLEFFKRFDADIKAIEYEFDLKFWHDDYAHGGSDWNRRIIEEIHDSDVFLLMISHSYIASEYIRANELPAISNKFHTRRALICPVVLSRCAWQQIAGPIQAMPRQNRTLVPISDWVPERHGFDEARVQISIAIREHFNVTPRKGNWFEALADLRQEQPGPLWSERWGQFELDPSGGELDKDASAQRVTQELHVINRDKSVAFAAHVAKLSNQLDPEWNGLIPAAEELAKLLSEPTEDLPNQIVTIWETSIRLGSFIFLSGQLAAVDAPPLLRLPPDCFRMFDDLVISLAPWLRRFPTVRALDDDRDMLLFDASVTKRAISVFASAQNANLISQRSARTLELLFGRPERVGTPYTKGMKYGVRGVRSLIVISSSTTAALLSNASGIIDQQRNLLVGKVNAFFKQIRDEVGPLTEGLPADIRYAIARLANVRTEWMDSLIVGSENSPIAGVIQVENREMAKVSLSSIPNAEGSMEIVPIASPTRGRVGFVSNSVEVGRHIRKGDPLIVLDHGSSNTLVRSPTDGLITMIFVQTGDLATTDMVLMNVRCRVASRGDKGSRSARSRDLRSASTSDPSKVLSKNDQHPRRLGDIMIPAPHIGVAWRGPAPGSSPFVEVGQTVEQDGTLLLFELMKQFTRMGSPCRGIVSTLHFTDGQAMNPGQPLMTIETLSRES